LIRDKIGINKTILLLFLVSVAWWTLSSLPGTFLSEPVYGLSLLKFWFVWGLGALIAEYYYNKKKLFNAKLIHALGIIILMVALSPFSFFYFIRPYCFLLLFAVSITWALFTKIKTGPIQSILIGTGLISYSMYLIHQPVIDIFFKAMRGYNPVIIIGAWMLFVVAVSYLGYRYIEKPSVKLGRYLFKNGRKAP
jgi:peptidoglycan/LPS O-acetylase OafA/YrhL